MEKPARSKGNFFQFIPGANSVTFHKPPNSPGHDKRPENSNKFKTYTNKGFSGPITSMIPAELRRKSRSGGGFHAAEPTSPKVSCMGQVILKHKKLKIKNQKKKKKISKSNPPSSPREAKKKKPFSGILRLFRIRKSDPEVVFDDPDKYPVGISTQRQENSPKSVQVQGRKAPSLGQMNRLASGRSSLANFNWTAHVPVASDDRNYHSDEEGGGGESDGEGDEDGIIIPYSAPIMLVGGGVALEPRKEIDLWKRRTMGPPRPLQLTRNTIRSK